MNSRAKPHGRVGVRRSIVLVFGENLHDSQSIAHLLVGLEPSLEGRIEARPRPVSLQRTAGVVATRAWLANVAKAVEATAAAGQPVSAVLVHRDADGPDPTGAVHRALAADLSAVRVGHPVVPVQAIEAWWLLHPAAVESVRPLAWRGALRDVPADVEGIKNPKKELVRRTRSSRRSYSEADSVAIAKAIRRIGCAPNNRCASFDRLRDLAATLR